MFKATKRQPMDYEARDVALKFCNEMARYLRRKEHELGLPSDFRVGKKGLLVSRSRSLRTCGGVSGIKVSSRVYPLVYPVTDNHIIEDREYKAFNNDHVIGGIKFDALKHPDLLFKMVVSHEMAHYVQYYIRDRTRHTSLTRKINWSKPHGDGFKKIYRLLRAEFINKDLIEVLPTEKWAGIRD